MRDVHQTGWLCFISQLSELWEIPLVVHLLTLVETRGQYTIIEQCTGYLFALIIRRCVDSRLRVGRGMGCLAHFQV